MSRKWRERRQNLREGKDPVPSKPATTSEALRRRRNRRLLFVGLVGLSFPILEVIAYQFRAITITVVNRSDVGIKGIKVAYSGGEFESAELKPGGSLTRQIRPDFSFQGEKFSTYKLAIRFASEDGGIFSLDGRAGALDFSAQEIYTVITTPPKGLLELQHSTRLGFPMSLVRGLMGRLGF